MTLEQLEQMLPNGLHDAKIRSLTRNFEEETLILAVSILVGLPDDPPTTRSRYSDALITFIGVKVFIVEAPDASSPFQEPGALYFRVDRIEEGTLPFEIENVLPKDAAAYSLFILDWLSTIHIVASDVNFKWASS